MLCKSARISLHPFQDPTFSGMPSSVSLWRDGQDKCVAVQSVSSGYAPSSSERLRF